MKLKRERGGVLLATLVFVIILSTATASILALSLYSHRLSLRNDLRAQARAVAETEMEWIYYNFMNLIFGGTSAGYAQFPNATTLLAASLPCDTGAQGTTVVPTTDRSPYLEAYRTAGWTVRRSVVYNQHKEGVIPSTGKRGTIDYIDVRVEVLPPASSGFAGSFSERVGRYFSCANTSIFQNAIFFQGDLEMAPGGDMTITGDISANGSIYMGAGRDQLGNPGTLTINNQVRYLEGHYFNRDSDGNTVYRKPGTPPGGTLTAPVFGTSEGDQVEVMTKPQNLLGGIDADALATARPDLFPSVNDVYRSLIAPPPEFATDQEYPMWVAGGSQPDDPTISAQRMYNRASLVITVNEDLSVHFRKKGESSDSDSDFTGIVTTLPTVYDTREGHDVYITEIDLTALADKLIANYSTFKGAVYVNLKNAYAIHPSAIRLKNGDTSPIFGNFGGQGLSVATNGGIYVLGAYNTTQIGTDASGNPIYNPAMLMGDSVTLLSSDGAGNGWSDANAHGGLDARVAHSRTDLDGTVVTHINAGILTGNVSSTETNASGGAQNLIRYLEDWTNISVKVQGSLGRLFDSKYYIRSWQQPGSPFNIYIQPLTRSFRYDNSFQTASPPESPTTTDFTRGGFFNW